MGEVVDLPKPAKKPQYCFTCPCGCQAFVLRPDARVECAKCEEIRPQLMWGQYFVSDKGIETGPVPPS